MHTVLALIDFSRVSHAVAREAAAIAHSFNGRVVLLHVLAAPPPGLGGGPEAVAEIYAAGEKAAGRQLETIERELREAGANVETALEFGPPVERIVTAADQFHAGHIVMGSHGHGAWHDLLIGSTTQGVLRRTRRTVVIVSARHPETAAARVVPA